LVEAMKGSEPPWQHHSILPPHSHLSIPVLTLTIT
jgi:hypothetical protein